MPELKTDKRRKIAVKENAIYRTIDANRNRLKEGLRVCEDITRYILDDTELTRKFKQIRHKVTDVLDKGPTLYVKVNMPPELSCLVTRHSFEEMELHEGKEVYLTFKATSIHLFD